MFNVSGFHHGDDFDESERKQWHHDVVVCFQKNAWVDAKTNQRGLCNMFKPVNEHLEEVVLVFKLKTIFLLTKLTLKCNDGKMNVQISQTCLYLKRMTWSLQAVDHYIRIDWKILVNRNKPGHG